MADESEPDLGTAASSESQPKANLSPFKTLLFGIVLVVFGVGATWVTLQIDGSVWVLPIAAGAMGLLLMVIGLAGLVGKKGP